MARQERGLDPVRLSGFVVIGDVSPGDSIAVVSPEECPSTGDGSGSGVAQLGVSAIAGATGLGLGARGLRGGFGGSATGAGASVTAGAGAVLDNSVEGTFTDFLAAFFGVAFLAAFFGAAFFTAFLAGAFFGAFLADFFAAFLTVFLVAFLAAFFTVFLADFFAAFLAAFFTAFFADFLTDFLEDFFAGFAAVKSFFCFFLSFFDFLPLAIVVLLLAPIQKGPAFQVFRASAGPV
ncbi:hypothetical protein AB8B21_18685 [Tardiphaga sp. 866_E4_N2_1]|uniref:hypothetical protein n=1 Tax=Tardiphaga sp. 866_E4_N2_1 TaxID=3240767 RepID=UPI003F22BF0C